MDDSKKCKKKKVSPAVAKVVQDWGKRQKAKAFGDRIMEGFYDYPFTNDQIEHAGEAVAMVLVDSSIWIGALRRNGDVRVKLALQSLIAEYQAAWCSVVKGEVIGGAQALGG